MKTKPLFFGAAIFIVAACSNPLHAGQYFQDFFGSSVGDTTFSDGSQLFSTTLGTVAKVADSKELQLTEVNSNSVMSAFELPDLDPGKPVYAFSVKWNSQVYGDFANSQPADGFSLNFGQLASSNLISGKVEAGYGAGLCFSVETYALGNPGFYLKVNGTNAAFISYNPNTEWGGFNDTRHFFEVDWNYINGMSVKMDGQTIFANVATTNFTPRAGDRFVWAARCGALTEEVRLDNIVVMTGGNLVQAPAISPYYGGGVSYPDPNSASAAFDGNNGTYWMGSGTPLYIGATVSPASAVGAYVLSSGGAQGMPTLWTFDGSANSGANWTSLANGYVNFVNHDETRAFPAANTNTFGAYRININDVEGGYPVGLGEMKFYTFNAVTLSPVAATAPASSVHVASATLNGQVNPNSFATTAWFEWGLTTNYGNVTANQNAGSGNVAVPVAATLAGLSSATTYHYQLVASNSFGASFGGDITFTTAILTIPWTLTSAPDYENWDSIASSADGAKLAAVTRVTIDGEIYTSTNSGADWTLTSAPDNEWLSIASSANGTKLAAVAYEDANFNPGGIYTSTNSGADWTLTSAPTNYWESIASSADGIKLAAVAQKDAAENPGGIYISTNSGTTWTLTSAPTNNWYSIASSADGKTLLAGTEYYLYVSVDSGSTWQQVNEDYPMFHFEDWDGLASSADGTKLAAAATFSDSGPGGIFTSTDSGATWAFTSAPSDNWDSIASSADGTKLLAGSDHGLYTSSDSGNTWQPVTGISGFEWEGVASSADGNELAAAANSGNIYTWQLPVINLALSASNLAISWTTNQTGLALQTTTNLAAPNWITATNAVISTNGQYQILISPTTGNQFFRLGAQ